MEDTYGPRLISFDPSYRSNPYVVDAGLADVERWQELAAPSSPTPSDDEASSGIPRSSGFPGATSLKYTTTIMGPSRIGALGLRTGGKRSSVQDNAKLALRRSVSLPRHQNGREEREHTPDEMPTMPASASPRTNVVTETIAETDVPLDSDEEETKPTAPTASSAPQLKAPPLEGAQVNVPIAFIPKFKGAAEMEARRRARMAHRNLISPGVPVVRPQVSAPATLNPERSLSSSSSSASSLDVEEQGVLADEDDEDDFDDDVVDDMDDDEFDP